MIDYSFLIIWIIWLFLLIFLFLFIFSQTILRIVRKFHKFPIPAFLTKIIDNPIRRAFIQKPEKLAERLDLSPGMIIVEVGPGKGNYSRKIAEKILPDGKVYAIDIQVPVIENLIKKIEKKNILNIIPKIDDAYHLSFKDMSVDRVFANTCLPEIPDLVKVLKECRRILKNDGIISLCEMFLDPDYPLRKTEKKWANEAGLELCEQFRNWFTYQLNFRKKIE